MRTDIIKNNEKAVNPQTHHHFKLDFKSEPTHTTQVVNPRHPTPQVQPVA